MTTEDIITGIIGREGTTFTNDPVDRGGPTKFGITLRDLRTWRNDPSVGAVDVETMTEAEARAIYRRRYIEDPGFDRIPNEWIRAFIVDTGVLQGPRVATKLLQRAVNVDPDGVFGPITLAAVQVASVESVRRSLVKDRLQHLLACALVDIPADLVQNTSLKFLKGWINRVVSFL